MPPPTPLATLRQQSSIADADRAASYGLKSWISSAKTALAEADVVQRTATASDDDAERVFVALRRWAGLMDVVIKHPDYKSVMAAHGPEWAQYNDMKPKLLAAIKRCKACEEQLARRDLRLGVRDDAGPSTPSSPPNGHASSSRPTSTSSAPDDGSTKRRPVSGSIAERMAALQGAGLNAASVNSPTRSARPTSIEEEMAVDPPPSSNGTSGVSSSPTAVLKGRRPLPAPPGQSGPVLPGPSFASPQERPTSAPPATAVVLDDFMTSFPAMDDFEHRFPDAPRDRPSDALPTVPMSAPASGSRAMDEPIGRAPSPPRFDMAVEMKRDDSASSVGKSAGLTRSPAMHKIAPSRPRDRGPSDPMPLSTSAPRHLPFTSSIAPDQLWALLRQPGSSSAILLLDVRSRDEHDRAHVAYGETVVVDPLVLRNEVGSDRIEQSLVLSSPSERERFDRRNRYDLIVVLDRASSMVPAPGVSADEPGRILRNLTSAIFEREFRRPLRRAPIILVGGIEAWRRQLGGEGLVGPDVVVTRRGSDSVGSASAPPPINHAARPGASTGSPNDAKRANRSAKVVGGVVDYALAQPPRTVVETLVHSPYNQQAGPSYFTRQASSSSFSGGQSPIASPPMAVTTSQSPRAGQASSFDYQAMVMPPYPPTPSGHETPPKKSVGDYPQLPAHAMPPAMQRPPLAAQPNGGVAARAPSNAQIAIAPPTRRLSSNHFSSSIPPSPSDFGSSYSNSAALSSMGLNWGDGTIGMTGLKNLGNTCYMNSTLQCLSATIPFARFFKDGSYKRAVNTINPLGTKGALATAVANLITVLWGEGYTFVSPVSFREAICHFASQFRGTDQHDSQEFLAFLLDGLHEDLNFVLHKPPPVPMTPERELALETMPQAQASAKEWDIYLRRDNSIIVQWFQGQYRSKLTCLTCGKTSTTYNAFMYLSVPIPASRTLHKVTLEQCIEAFVKEEVLEKDDMWNCPRCKVPRKAQKKLSISRVPPILLIHLKRFSFRGIFSDRIDTNIHFPLYGLDLQGYLPPDPQPKSASSGSTTYDLYAVSQHFGTLSSGHYTALVRSRDRWNEIGDSKVRPCDDADVRKATKSAYILYYRRRGP